MKDNILEKLKIILSKSVKNEYQVMYVMVELRKLLDRLNLKYPLLRFYCSWAVHTEIDRISSAREILEKIANEHKGRKGLTIIDFVGLHLLKKEIKDFCKEYDLPKNWLEGKKWHNFQHSLLEILKDCPLIGKCDPIEKFSFVEPRHDGNDIDWVIKFPNDPIEYKGSLTELN